MRDSDSEFRLSNGEGIFFRTNAIAIPCTKGDCPHVSSVGVPTQTLINLPGAPENFETNDDQLACQPEAPEYRNLAAALHTGALRTSPEVWRECEVSDITCNITSQNAQKVLFDATTGRPVAFDVSHSDELVGSTESLRAGLAERGCSLEILDKLWVENHKRWIVWKLASYERSFCDFLGGKYLTFERLLEGLERRYKVELVGGKRPATRMILHRDAAASLPMILCVSELILSGGSLTDEHAEDSRLSTRLRLTDGWYEIEAALDTLMGSLITKGIVRVGTKLLVSHAVLRGAEQGIDPLDADYASTRPYLVLTANSTRLAKWDSKLGFLRVSSAPLGPKFCPVKRVSDIVAGGGDVHFLRLLVMRRFPIMYLERGSTGKTTLSEAEEDEKRRELERRRTRAIEKLSDAVTKEVEKVSRLLLFC
jgi:breast cancer 2 susceptibility protein